MADHHALYREFIRREYGDDYPAPVVSELDMSGAVPDKRPIVRRRRSKLRLTPPKDRHQLQTYASPWPTEWTPFSQMSAID